jgi:hypothetical protein
MTGNREPRYEGKAQGNREILPLDDYLQIAGRP